MPEVSKKVPLFSPQQITIVQNKNPFAKISDIVYNILGEGILSGAIPPGARLNIASIATKLNISRTPVFAAVERLVADGMVVESTASPGKYRNYFALDMSDDAMTDLFNARSAIESAAAALCAANMAIIDLDKMDRLAREFQAAWKAAEEDKSITNFSDRAEADKAFHEFIVTATENRYLIDMYRSIAGPLSYLSVRTCELTSARDGKSNIQILGSQHLAICRAIRSGLTDMARLAAVQHISFCSERCLLGR